MIPQNTVPWDLQRLSLVRVEPIDCDLLVSGVLDSTPVEVVTYTDVRVNIKLKRDSKSHVIWGRDCVVRVG